MHVSPADSQVSAVKRFTGKDGRPGILIVNCCSVQQRNASLKGARNLRGRPIYVNPNYTKVQAQEQFRLRQLRREAISKGDRAYIKAGQVVIVADPNKQHSSPSYAQATAASTSNTPAAAPSAAPALMAAATPAAAPSSQ